MWTRMVARLGVALFIMTAAAVAGMGWLIPSDGAILLVISEPGDPALKRDDVRDLNLLDFDRGLWARIVRYQRADNLYPSASPDGSAFVFDAGGEIYRLDWPSLDITNLTNTYYLYENSPQWSPDGTRIAFIVPWVDDRPPDLFVMGPDGRERINITEPREGAEWFSWSPDSSQLVFGAPVAGSGEPDVDGTYMVNADGGDLRRIHDRSRFVSWSPKGNLIAFSDANAGMIVIVDDGGNDLHTFPTSGLTFSWSPDGTYLAYLDEGIMLFDPSSGDSHKLAGMPAAPFVSPDFWSPDGSRFLLWTGDPSTGGYSTMGLGGEVRAIFNQPGYLEYGAQWSADGSRYVFLAEDYSPLQVEICMVDVAAGSVRCRNSPDQTAAIASFWLP